MHELFNNKIEKYKRIIITSHILADFDAISSMLLMYSLLGEAYPQSKIEMYLEGEPFGRSDELLNADKINYVNKIHEQLNKEDLLIILDANSYRRITRYPKTLKKHHNTITFDHHEKESEPHTTEIIDTSAVSTTQILAETLCDCSDIEDPEIAKLALVGILADSNSLLNVRSDQARVFDLVKKLVTNCDVSLQEVTLLINSLNEMEAGLIRSLINNTKYHKNGTDLKMCYTYISKTDIKTPNISDSTLNSAKNIYKQMYMEKLEDCDIGFIAFPMKDERFSVSIMSNDKDVKVNGIAVKFGGGGHPYAAGWRENENACGKDCKCDSDQVCEIVKEKVVKSLSSTE